MPRYRLDINGVIGLSDYSAIADYMHMVQKNDNLTVVFNENNSNDGDMVCSILEGTNFQIQKRGRNNDGKFIICAQRKS